MKDLVFAGQVVWRRQNMRGLEEDGGSCVKVEELCCVSQLHLAVVGEQSNLQWLQCLLSLPVQLTATQMKNCCFAPFVDCGDLPSNVGDE